MPWKVQLWVTGLARSEYADRWQGRRKTEDNVEWFEWHDFVCEHWEDIPRRASEQETLGLYHRMKYDIEEVEIEIAPDGPDSPPTCVAVDHL